MIDRRTTILDAAVSVVGAGGARALTHRAVDAAAGLPAGSASNLFRTREALLVGLVERCVERERAAWVEAVDAAGPASPRALAAALADLAVRQVTTDRDVTLTRCAILVEAATTPAVRDALTAGGQDVMARAVALVASAGSPTPEADAAALAHWVFGAGHHELANPSGSFAPQAPLTALVQRLIKE